LIECGHWHSGMYVNALKQMEDVNIVAFSDRDALKARAAAARVGAKAYASHRELLDKEQPDFVFAFGRHCDMTDIARDLVEAGVAFCMEKPMGIEWRRLAEVAKLVEEKEIFTALPVITRGEAPIARLAGIRDEGKLGDVRHFYFRLFGGPPARYVKWGVPWMLRKAEAGGGPLFNFGPHGIDLFLYLSGDPVRSVSASMDNRIYGNEVEDFASVTMTTASGAVGVVEVSYLLPKGYERFVSINTTTLSYSTLNWENRTIMLRDGGSIEIEEAPEFGYEGFVRDTIAAFREGREPIADIRDMCRILPIMNAAVESAESGRRVDVPLDACGQGESRP